MIALKNSTNMVLSVYCRNKYSIINPEATICLYDYLDGDIISIEPMQKSKAKFAMPLFFLNATLPEDLNCLLICYVQFKVFHAEETAKITIVKNVFNTFDGIVFKSVMPMSESCVLEDINYQVTNNKKATRRAKSKYKFMSLTFLSFSPFWLACTIYLLFSKQYDRAFYGLGVFLLSLCYSFFVIGKFKRLCNVRQLNINFSKSAEDYKYVGEFRKELDDRIYSNETPFAKKSAIKFVKKFMDRFLE